jgi:hypothetical protein
MRSIVEAAIKEGAEKKGKKITLSLSHLQAQNDLLEAENKGLRHALNTKKKHKEKNKPLDLQQREEYHGGAVFWSPSNIREARYRERVRSREEEEEKVQKAERRHIKEQAALLKKIEQDEAKVERERKKKKREEERKRKAAERAENQRRKQQEREAAIAQKALQLYQKGREQLHKVLSLRQSVGVVRKLLKVVLVVGILHRTLHPKSTPAAGNQNLVIIAIVGDYTALCL